MLSSRHEGSTASGGEDRGRASRVRRAVLVGVLVSALMVLAVVGAAHALTSRYAWARAVAWMESDVGDQHRFPARTIRADETASPLPRGPEPPGLGGQVNVGMVGQPLEVFLRGTDTSAFLVVHHDKLVYERYFGEAGRARRLTSFSAAKSFVSTLVGIAIDQGSIGSVDDPVTTYLPELEERDDRFAAITIRDLLTMSSGIRYVERGLPWSDDALTYYGTDLRDLALTHTHVEEPPGVTWRYNNYHPLLLGMVLERATGMSVSDFMSTYLWRPMGAEADATWSLDSTRSGLEKLESGVNARAADFARFGLVMLHDGRWNGREIVSPEWVAEATAWSTETDPASFYQYLWWVSPPRADTRPDFFARGKYGQTIGVFPEHDMVVVRLGSSDGGVDWQARLTEIAALAASGG